MSSHDSEDVQSQAHPSLEATSEHQSPAPSDSSQHQPRSSQQSDEHHSSSQEEKDPTTTTLPKSPASSQPEEPQEPTVDYIVTLKRNTTPEDQEAYKQKLLQQGSVIKHEYKSVILKGFAVSIKPSLLQSFQQDPAVLDIEIDGKVHI